MRSHYIGETARAKYLRMGAWVSDDWGSHAGGIHIYPVQEAGFIRKPLEADSGDEAVTAMVAVKGLFGLLPRFAKDIHYGKRTYTARTETVAELASLKQAWAKAQHCIIPADAIYEHDWRTGKFVPTRISRADGETLGVAGLWNSWKAPSGEWMNSFTMQTINADTHPIFRELHRPDPKLPPHMQDKRMVVILNEDDYLRWSNASPADSLDFMRQYPAERLVAAAKPAPTKPKAEPKAKAKAEGQFF